MRRNAALLLSAMVGAGFTVVRDPDAVVPIVWPTGQVTVVLQQDGSDDVDDGSDLQAMRDALAVWNAPACSAFIYTEQQPPTATRGDAVDGVNRISFLESGWPSGAPGAVALTTRRRNTVASPDVWTEVDIILNGQDYPWATNGELRAYDIQSTVVHELGHVLGLAHTPSPEATMYFGGRRGRTAWRTLDADDIAGLCYLYPAAAFVCAVDGDCPLFDDPYGGTPLRQRCAAPNCVTGAVGYGQACWATGECSAGVCLRELDLAPLIDPGFCAVSCPTGSCANGDLCADRSGTDYCLLGYDDCVIDQDCGGANAVCIMDLDSRFRCVGLCLTLANCSGGEVCHGGTGANPPGFCRLPGAKANGATCADGFECQSLTCAGGGVTPTCSAAPVPPDGGPTDGAPTDGGSQEEPAADAAPGDPWGTDATRPDAAPGDSFGDSLAPADEATVVGGCACHLWGSPTAWWGVLALCLLRRRRCRRMGA